MNAPFVPPVTVTSSALNPVTGSENANVAVNTELITVGTPVISSVGRVESLRAVTRAACAGPALPATSSAACGPTSTATSPSPDGTTTSVKSDPLPPNAPFVPPVTVTSSASNPLTGSENTNVAVNGDLPTTSAGTAISSVGAVVSHAAVALTASVGPALPATSTAAPGPTSTVTAPVPDGVTTSV